MCGIDQEERLRTTGMQVESERAARGVADAALRQAEQAMDEVRWRKFPATGITTYSLGLNFQLRTAVELHQRQLADKNHSSESRVDGS